MIDAYLELVVLTLIVTFGFIIVTYEQFAVPRVWFIEPSLRGNSYVKLAGVFSIFMAPGLAFYLFPWWQGAIVLVAGLVLFRVLIALFKSRSQHLAAGGLIACWIVFFVNLAHA
ncbi:MAG: hypothetical protein AMJ68_03125 [Acidithiobacillales bacterium SG8_45]|jgi:hypothetical protein|nr:MAG: hypothetical protein AMJ68_03125 [Acidithiobacillales bacterium SG8_45]